MGPGYTLVSGVTSTAAAVAHKLGSCDSDITVHEPDGQVEIQFDKNFVAAITGSVTKICEESVAGEMFEKTF